MIVRRHWLSWIALLIVFIVPAAAPAKPRVSTKVIPASLDCGPIALHALLRLEGHPTAIDEVAARLPVPRPGGFSLKELRDASGNLGLPLAGLAIGKDVRAVDRPMLVFLKVDRKGHFVAIRPVGHTGKLVQVIDSNQPPRVMDKADLVSSGQWTGVVLAPRRTDWPVVAAAGVLTSSCLGVLWVAILRRRASSVSGG